MGKPGIVVPNRPPSGDSYVGVPNVPGREGDPSYSTLNVGASDCTGVSETRGGAGPPVTVLIDDGLSPAATRERTLFCELYAVCDGRRFCSFAGAGTLGGALLVVVMVLPTAVESGARLDFIRENIEETSV